MSIKTTLNYSPNFHPKKRSKDKIKFIIIHYTGMKNINSALKRLKNIQSEVSAHYLIEKNGKITTLVPDLFIAWHAGISYWKNLISLNKDSIGIEIENPGHTNGYKNFSKHQIISLIKLTNFLIKKFRINKQNILGHSDIAPDRKKDPGEKFPWKLLAKKGIGFWHNLDLRYLQKLRIKKCNKLEEKIFFYKLKKLGYNLESVKIKNSKKNNFVTKAFQRRFRPQLIDGKVDQECLKIIKNLT